MRRYLLNFDTDTLPTEHTDVLVVGAGIAGLWTALHLDDKTSVTVLCKYDPHTSNSFLAQGGVAAVVREDDTFESHMEDTFTAGAGLCNHQSVETLVKEAPEAIRELIDLEVPFDRTEDGELAVGREGGHSCRRILHSGGDATGRIIVLSLLEAVAAKPSVTLSPNTALIDILTDDDGVVGALVEKDGALHLIRTPNVVLATGGIGRIYRYTTNPKGANGEGIAAAVRAGTEVDRMEMVQFHPTTFYSQKTDGRLFLISEAVRGEGAILRNSGGEAFMEHVHKLKDLAPRDIVTRGILKELQYTGEEYARLDVSSMTREFFSKRFPTIFGQCEASGLHLTDDMIPVHPAQHYFMGGISVDLNGRTSVPGLWAVGECACNGVHGGNRLASNSMLECLVFGKRVALDVLEASLPSRETPVRFSASAPEATCDLSVWRKELRHVMDENVGAIRTEDRLQYASSWLSVAIASLEHATITSKEQASLYGMLTVAQLIVDGARRRPDSIGAHYMLK